jgi:hypothetical protein
MGGRGQNRHPAEDLPGSQPMEEYLATVTRQDEVSASTACEKEESFSGILLMNDHRGCDKSPVSRCRQDGIEFGLRQS